MIILLGLLVWLALSVVVALVLGGVLARRNEQLPFPVRSEDELAGPLEVEVPVGAVPGPRSGRDGPITGGAARPAPVPGS